IVYVYDLIKKSIFSRCLILFFFVLKIERTYLSVLTLVCLIGSNDITLPHKNKTKQKRNEIVKTSVTETLNVVTPGHDYLSSRGEAKDASWLNKGSSQRRRSHAKDDSSGHQKKTVLRTAQRNTIRQQVMQELEKMELQTLQEMNLKNLININRSHQTPSDGFEQSPAETYDVLQSSHKRVYNTLETRDEINQNDVSTMITTFCVFYVFICLCIVWTLEWNILLNARNAVNKFNVEYKQ
ncbi:hypothetical protein RFI_28569, partial [Reticulomyxa filosa]